MSDLTDLRRQALDRAGGRCEWCDIGGTDGHNLQLAHLVHRKMGGNVKANRLDNVAILCEWHHDILDGRTVQGRHREVALLLGRALGR